MIMHDLKAVFVRTNKTAGASIEQVLLGRNTGWHDAARKLQLQLSRRLWRSYFSFAFVRNPWDRMLSLYFHYRRRLPTQREYIPPSTTFAMWLPRALSRGQRELLFRPLWYWVSDPRGDQIVDFIGRFENLQADFDKVCRRLRLPQQTLPHLNANAHEHYTTYYTQEMIDAVAEVHADDVRRFGYEFGA